MNVSAAPEEEADINEILKIRKEKLAELIAAGKNPYEIVKFDKENSSADIIDNYPDYEGKTVSLAGRLVSKRVMGKASFGHLLDGQGQIQLYFKKDVLGDDVYEDFKKYDIGDIIGVKGEVFTTHKGEISVKVTELSLLSKSLLPLPEKWHGLTNTDLRYRQRYVDLIANPEVKKTFVVRSRIISAIREFLDGEGFIEVENRVNASICTENTIIATGGSVIYGAEAMKHLRSIGTVIYIRLSYQTVSERLGNIRQRGVVLKEGQTLYSLYQERCPLYQKYAHLTIDAEGMDTVRLVSILGDQNLSVR